MHKKALKGLQCVDCLVPERNQVYWGYIKVLNFSVLQRVLVLAMGVFTLDQSQAACHAYYVSNAGNDGGAGTISSPWRTIAKAAAKAVACDTVYVRGGVYREAVVFRNSGTSSSPITFRAYGSEIPIVDGGNALPGDWAALLDLRGSYIRLDGFEVRNSRFYGVQLWGKSNYVTKLNVHHAARHGIFGKGDYSLIEGNRVWQNSRLNTGTGWQTGIAVGGGSNGDRVTSYAVVRGNTVFNNWGEGIASYIAGDHIVIENNTVYDNYFINLYVANTTNALVQRNLVYATPRNAVGKVADGIRLADEGSATGYQLSSNISLVNNLVYGANRNFVWVGQRKPSSMKNVVVAYNTFANAASTNMSIGYGDASHYNVRFINNIVSQDSFAAISAVDTRTRGVAFSNNLWSRKPSALASSGTDVIGDPKFGKLGSIAAGVLTGNWFKLQSASPARNRAAVIGSIPEDYFRRSRGSAADMGGAEY